MGASSSSPAPTRPRAPASCSRMPESGRRSVVSAPDRLRVLFLAHAYPRLTADPVGSFIHNLAVAVRDDGVAAVVVAPSAPGAPSRDVIDGVPVFRLRDAPRRFETLAYTGTM